MQEERPKSRSTLWLAWQRVERIAARATGILSPLLAVVVFGAIVIAVLFLLALLALAIVGAL